MNRKLAQARARNEDAFEFGVGIDVNNSTGEILAVYFQVRKGTASNVVEMANGAAFVNYNKRGQLLGVELLAPCSISVLDRIAQNEPLSRRSYVRKFFRRSVPREMVAA
jgi:hypothetical protein